MGEIFNEQRNVRNENQRNNMMLYQRERQQQADQRGNLLFQQAQEDRQIAQERQGAQDQRADLLHQQKQQDRKFMLDDRQKAQLDALNKKDKELHREAATEFGKQTGWLMQSKNPEELNQRWEQIAQQASPEAQKIMGGIDPSQRMSFAQQKFNENMTIAQHLSQENLKAKAEGAKAVLKGKELIMPKSTDTATVRKMLDRLFQVGLVEGPNGISMKFANEEDAKKAEQIMIRADKHISEGLSPVQAFKKAKDSVISGKGITLDEAMKKYK